MEINWKRSKNERKIEKQEQMKMEMEMENIGNGTIHELVSKGAID